MSLSPVPIPALTTQQMVEVDRLMIEEYGILLIQMMENAGRSLAELARNLSGSSLAEKKIVVLCGPGNNGGGGMVAARHLHNWGAQVQAILVGDAGRLKDVPAHQWRILQRMGLTSMATALPPSDLIVDAMLGYGAQGDPRSPIREWILAVNQSHTLVLALDAPSGLDTTTGEPGSPCIQATVTLTLALPKMGLLVDAAAANVGRLYVADISVPPELYTAPGLGLQVDSLFTRQPIVEVS